MLSSPKIQVCFVSLHPGQLLWAACLHGPDAAPGKKCSHADRSSFTGTETPGPCSATSAVEHHDIPQCGEGMQSSKTTTGPLFLFVGPNTAFSLTNSGVSQALQGLDSAELEPLLCQYSPLGFQGIIPDLCWSG